ncbi:MAG: hypothetical protein GY703_08855 [Gammaproteobacteria bacterium]|nr:hypothetical protein [Gammaproteobacteria bacterium]
MKQQNPLSQSIRKQREKLAEMFELLFRHLAEACAHVWNDRENLNQVLLVELEKMPHCKFLYAMNPNAVQISDNISHDGLITSDFGRDRSPRPYIREVGPGTGFLLSQAYISLRAKRPSLTAIQVVTDNNGAILGYIGADFDLRDLPLTRHLYDEPRHWRQIKGDPSIRGTVFHQTRFESAMDLQIDTVNGVVEALMVDHGGFHLKMHFSSSRGVLWLMDEPYRYRLLDLEALTDPNTCLAYPKRPYPTDAMIPPDKIRPIFEGFKKLRFQDEMLYLRAGTLNIFNGIIGLTFSCDGSHYVPYDEFLDPDSVFWMDDAEPGI